MKEYKVRIADTLLEERLDAFGAVLVEGAKACGKSTIHSGLVMARMAST